MSQRESKYEKNLTWVRSQGIWVASRSWEWTSANNNNNKKKKKKKGNFILTP